MIRKPKRDPREYKHLTLDNGLSAIIVSDSENQVTSAAALSVGVGSLDEPDDAEGLAHFVEHMCFMGSDKYPGENDFGEFIDDNGGYTNACTRSNTTVYEFNIDSEWLEKGLDMFAQFFVAPLISDDAVDREIKAVHSEFEMCIKDDAVRLQELILREIPNSRLNRFQWGNAESLNIPNISARCKEFWSEFYCAEKMTLCVVGGGVALHDLEAWVRTSFAGVRSNPQSPNLHKQIPAPICERVIRCSVPVKDKRKLCFTWIIPPFWKRYKTQPTTIVTSLLGHESKGSILYKLYGEGIAAACSAGCASLEENFEMLYLEITLTQYGIQQWKEAVNTVFQYITMLQHEGIPQEFHEEIKKRCDLEFEYYEKIESVDYCVSISQQMQRYPMADVLTAGVYDLIEEISVDDVTELLGYLGPNGVIIDLISPEFAPRATLKEKWFGVQYFYEQCYEIESGFSSDLSLPPPIEFFPENFELIDEINQPAKLYSSKLLEVWYAGDNTFKIPKANANLLLQLPDFQSSITKYVTSHLITEVLKDELNADFGYLAHEAGFEITIKAIDQGIQINLSGFSDKLTFLIEKIMAFVYNFKPDPQRTQILIEKLGAHYRNQILNPQHLCSKSLLTFLYHDEYLQAEKSREMLELSQQPLEYDLAHVKVVMYLCGAVNELDVLDLIDCLEGLFHAAEVKRIHDIAPRTVVVLPEQPLVWDIQAVLPDNQNSSVIVYYQFGQASLEESIQAELLGNIFSEPLFDELRTKQQLGYYVASYNSVNRGVAGMQFRLCSAEYSPAVLIERLETYLSTFDYQKYFNKQRKSLITIKQEPYNNLSEKMSAHWREIRNGDYEFDRRTKEIAFLKELTYENFSSWIAGSTFPNRKLTIKVTAQKWGSVVDEYSQCLRDEPVEFRNRFPCYSLLRFLH